MTPAALDTPAKVHPPAGWAPVIDPAGEVEGTTCLMTETEPVQLPWASAFSAAPAAA